MSGPVTAIGAVIGAVMDSVGLGGLADVLASLPVVLGLALTFGLSYALAKVGLARWHDWDRRERRAMHPETPSLPDRSIAGAQAMLLVAGVITLALSVFGLGLAAALVLVLGAAAGLVIWARRPFR